MEQLEPGALPAPVLKDKRAYWLYQIPIIALASLPLLVVIGLVIVSWAGVQLASEVITILGTLAATALGGLVNMITTRGPDGQ